MSSSHVLEVIKDFERALENEENYDVIIKAGEEPKELRAHSFVLRTRCPYFKRALSENWEEKDDNGNFIFKKPNISVEVFKLILKYLYTGIADLSQHSKEMILQCLFASDELGLDKLIDQIQDDLINNEESTYKDPVSTLKVIYQHEPFERLKDYCLEIISEEPMILFSSKNFSSLEKEIIIMVLQRDDLNMEEIDIWDSIIRWLFVHNLKFDDDNFKLSSEDIANFKNTTKEFIPLIRFYDISREDFYLKVYPYKDLLPKDLIHDVLRYHMVPDSTPMLNFKPSRGRKHKSILIDNNVFMRFAKWIDKTNEDYTKKTMPYRFELLLRGTRDGFGSAKFHQLCDDKGATISFSRVSNNQNQIIGGYNPLNWYQTEAYASSNDSFIFNITNISDLNSAKVGRCNNSNNAIYYHSNYGPTFGSGHDLRAQGNTTWSTSNGSTYSSVSLPNNSFTIDEYEVYRIVKKRSLQNT
ncbi:hypothetical protein GLOIN_2v1534689 [Rhizophagus irregularis DAOM 181602=DAOM 197198]|uniref:Uncharacterized protein n=2 Tax=Rhizophagus irregularis TaxID=588596 RepID=U9UMT8_RHIID|nr:hypothetical protein GLOIN_2v1534689 [Rhizophagus irregularis DAOM 181602=DAOM 197198]EXX51710.1 hypothetical protein RirG_259290 [Rhizophagus irregularis DAOM 197198w]POG78754.1 hypothetical protein GLOIN_2v1534689 [Rhizophagus irregularis DAOM 181602=DAOM 197198]GBC51948.1 hypothetical protein GLOIN_2v1534689 [Rhizophagus irregularis DAOM 181602=DAOM 197198]|eukprot:XP_025185620.1 hypothetical protein GLOIN_2v1534689 [Rhizophagus irregularis DAOM 181602=DAOM 197198]